MTPEEEAFKRETVEAIVRMFLEGQGPPGTLMRKYLDRDKLTKVVSNTIKDLPYSNPKTQYEHEEMFYHWVSVLSKAVLFALACELLDDLFE